MDRHQDAISRLALEDGVGTQPAFLDEAHLAIGTDSPCVVRQYPKSHAAHVEVGECIVNEDADGILAVPLSQ